MRCCLIGGSGFIGSHLASLLAVGGRELTVVGRRDAPTRLPNGAKYVRGDYGDQQLLRKLISQTDEVVDLAYATVPQTSFVDPVFDILETNGSIRSGDRRDVEFLGQYPITGIGS